MKYPSIHIYGNIISADLLNELETEDKPGQKPKDFGLPAGRRVREEISQVWSEASTFWKAYKRRIATLPEGNSGEPETRNFWITPLLGLLGYTLRYESKAELINDKTYHISDPVVNLDKFPVLIIGFNQDLDRKPSNLRMSPHGLLQEYLNYKEEHLFGLVTNGRILRLLRDSGRIIRLSFLEMDLERIMEEDLYADFAVLFRLMHATRMPQKQGTGQECLMEQYHQEALASGTRIREKLSEAVEEAIMLFGNGFLNNHENRSLIQAFENNKIDASEYYRRMLGLIYRLLFIMVIEERDLIYDPAAEDKLMRKKEIYNHYYSLARLRRLSGNSSILNERFQDIWISLRNTFRLFEDGNKGKFLEIKPLNGDLFSVNGLGMLEQSELSNKILFEALNTLSWFKTPQGQILPVNYKLLNVEEFGSVYEGLLEYDPVVIKQSGQWSFKLVGGEGRARSGSHYTPEELVQPLIKHSLDYLLQDREALIKKEIEQTGLKGESKRNERESVIQKHLLSLKICDVACGSGHILLSAARRVADRYSSWLEESDQPTPSGVRHAIRHVVRNCIYGVDKNPLAVELCKVALWLEAHNPGEPLSFLDHHIKNGDSIVGLAYRDELENGIPDEAFRTLLGDEKEIASTLLKKNREERKIRLDKKAGVQLTTETIESGVQEFMAEYDAFSRLPENNPKEIDLKAKAYKKFIDGKGFTFLKAMADTQVAQFFISKTETTKENLMTDADFRRILSGYKGLQDRKVTKATVISFEKRFFHWFIEFPEVFQQSGSSLSEKPGFNCILGNPPFLGGLKISTNYGNHYLSYLHYKYSNAKGTCDIVAYFFRRIFSILSLKGFMSLISTNTISQGDTRTGGIENILSEGGGINYAIKSIKWPGVAAVDVSLISIFKGKYNNLNKLLNGKQVNDINSFLDNSSGIQTAQILKTNESKSFIGSNILGEGFILENTDAKSILSNSQNYKNVIFPYLSGDDLNNEPNQIAKRFVINFHNYPLRRFNDDEWNDLIDVDKMEIKQMILVNSFIYYAPPDYEKEVASDFPICIEIIKNKVKPEREKLKDKNPKERWWLYERQRKELYDTINNNGSAFAISRVTKYCIFSKVSLENVYSNATVIFSLKDPLTLFLNSSLHDIWCWKYGSTMGTGTLRYTPSDCFETFAFPPKLSLNQVKKLTHIYEQYYAYRKKLMLKIKLGLTKTYNVFHAKEIQAGIITTTLLNLDKKAIEKQFQKEVWNLWNHLQKTTGTCILEEAIAGIVKLRELHVQMDNAVLEAYDWPDIQLKHDFYEVDYLPENDRIRFTIYPEARKEILKRLLELNHKIFEEEALQGLHKEEIVKKFYEQKGQPVPEEVSKWFGKGKPKPYKKSKSSQQSNEPGEGYGDLFNQNR